MRFHNLTSYGILTFFFFFPTAINYLKSDKKKKKKCPKSHFRRRKRPQNEYRTVNEWKPYRVKAVIKNHFQILRNRTMFRKPAPNFIRNIICVFFFFGLNLNFILVRVLMNCVLHESWRTFY